MRACSVASEAIFQRSQFNFQPADNLTEPGIFQRDGIAFIWHLRPALHGQSHISGSNIDQ